MEILSAKGTTNEKKKRKRFKGVQLIAILD
jgi:hypothetical protein